MLVHSTTYYPRWYCSVSSYLWQVFGFLSCIAFVVDMVLNHKLFQTQRAQEMPSDQGPPQRRVWDVNTEYMRSSMFYVKLAEIVSLLKSALTILSSGNFQKKLSGGASERKALIWTQKGSYVRKVNVTACWFVANFDCDAIVADVTWFSKTVDNNRVLWITPYLSCVSSNVFPKKNSSKPVWLIDWLTGWRTD